MSLPGAVAALVLAVALAGEAPTPKKKASVNKELPGELVEFKTKDGWTLGAQYLPAQKDQLTFILLHEARGRRQNWYLLSHRLKRRGFGYLALDLRGHGASQHPPQGTPASWREFRKTKLNNEWDNMREDVAAAAAYLQEKGVLADSIGIGGADVGGSIALKYAALHPEIELVFMLSPGFSYQEVLTVNAMRAFKGRPILLVVAADDRKSSAETAILYQFAQKSAGPENVGLLNVERKHGTRMLHYNKGLMDKLLDWIEDPVQFSGVSLGVSNSSAPLTGPGPVPNDGGLPSEEQLDTMGDNSSFDPAD